MHSKPSKLFLLFFFLLGLVAHPSRGQSGALHTVRIRSANDLKKFLKYSDDRIPVVSAHRGGARKGYPENCIATFENTLSHIFSFLEIDPRLTKDSVIVLMHDPTLDRTTNGSGKVADHTWAELRDLKLKDTEGNLTEFGIPTLDEVLEWARGKTILILDKKTVPLEITARKIREHHAESYAMVMAYSYAEAQRYHELNKDICMEVFIPNREKLSAFDRSGVPWENVVVFIAHSLPEDKGLYDLIHQKGALCIVGSSRKYDAEYAAGKKDVYEEMIGEGVDIIEADQAIEAGTAISHLAPARSRKAKYFVSSAPE